MFCLAHDSTDELRMAVKEAICENEIDRKLYEEAIISITVDEPLQRYVLETLTENEDLNVYSQFVSNVMITYVILQLLQADCAT